ncbi:hypothetical protein DEAC_c14370 [Desulfosporosinus acididurans]|uniref:Uncharacterized protein n=1 Tax=Desulfosporosinus acididurans TaxID=476652 RepID=A0A0J1FTG7_9FIRM|nr:hypothetical protein [Desulfosporosinus acididurans]KLU66769.1 hypothetical protein DEAC_c14370 [Desulfosporosinus acididurans]
MERIDLNMPGDSLYTGALKINAAFDEIEAALALKIEAQNQPNGSVVIPIGGGFKCRYNARDSSVDIEFSGSGIPYLKSDTTFVGTRTDVEVV